MEEIARGTEEIHLAVNAISGLTENNKSAISDVGALKPGGTAWRMPDRPRI
jgi:hypothetical protein